MQSQVSIKGVVQCGEDTVEVCTVCGQDYDGNPIPGETFAQCLERHRAKKAEVARACSGGGQ